MSTFHFSQKLMSNNHAGSKKIRPIEREQMSTLTDLDKVENTKGVGSDCVDPLYFGMMHDDQISQLLQHLRWGRLADQRNCKNSI